MVFWRISIAVWLWTATLVTAVDEQPQPGDVVAVAAVSHSQQSTGQLRGVSTQWEITRAFCFWIFHSHALCILCVFFVSHQTTTASAVHSWEASPQWHGRADDVPPREERGLVLKRRPASTASRHDGYRRGLRNRDLTVINDCGTRVSHFKAYYNVDAASHSYDAVTDTLRDGDSLTVTLDGADDTLLRYYAVDVVYRGGHPVLTEIDTRATEHSSIWSGGVNFRIADDGIRNFPIYAVDVGGLSEYRLCGGSGSGSTATVTTASRTGSESAAAVSAALASCDAATDATSCRAWITAHNARRAVFHRRRGSTSPSLVTWDADLAVDAQAWADALRGTTTDCDLRHDPTSSNGENLALNAGTGSYGTPRTPEEVLVAWWDDEYPLTQPPDRTLEGAGHFTQAAWYASTRLGCGTITKDSVIVGGDGREYDAKCNIQVCRYGPNRGNCNLDIATWEADVMSGRTC